MFNQKKWKSQAYHKADPDNYEKIIEDYILVARDDEKKSNGEKEFNLVHLEKFPEFMEYLANNNEAIYEVIPENTPRKLYFDIEVENPPYPSNDYRKKIDEFIQAISQIINNDNQIKIDKKNIVILDSSTERKLSYHLIFNNQIYFKNQCEQKEYMLYLDKVLLGEMYDVIPHDTKVYSKNRLMRCINQGKKKSCRVLKLVQGDKNDSLITLYPITKKIQPIFKNEILSRIHHDWKEIKLDKICKEEQEKNTKDYNTGRSLKLKKNNRPKANTSFIYKGTTLMEKYNKSFEELKRMNACERLVYIIPNPIEGQSYFNWKQIGFAIKYTGGDEELWKDWSMLATEKYVDGETKQFETFRTEGHCYGYSTLYTHAKKANPKICKELTPSMEQYYHIDLGGIKHIKEDCQYVSCGNKNILDPNPILVIGAYMGKGKTTALHRLIKKNKYDKILILSSRISFAQFMSEEFKIPCYCTDLENNYNKLNESNSIVISIESLWKLNHEKTYDCVIIDESESILKQFSSRDTLSGNVIPIWSKFCRFIQSASKVIFADAFLKERTFQVAKSFGKPITYLENKSKPIERTAIEIKSVEEFDEKLNKEIKEKKKKIYCPYSKKEDLNILKYGIQFNNDESYVTKFYDSSIGSNGDNELKNVNKNWVDAQLVGTTPKITVGISYTNEPSFDVIFAKSRPTCCVRDFFQMLMRPRKLKENIVYYNLPNRAFSQTNECFEAFNNYINHLRKMKKYNNENNFNYEEESTDSTLQYVMYFNKLEDAYSNNFFEEMFHEFLKDSNYKIIRDEKNQKKEKEKPKEKTSEEYLKEFNTIKLITDEKCREINDRREKTEEEKSQIEKYYYLISTNPNLTEEDKAKLYYKVWKSSRNRKLLRNIEEEARNNLQQTHQSDVVQSGCVELLQNTALKLKIIKELNEKIGIKNSYEEAIIPREKFENIESFIWSKRDFYLQTFGKKSIAQKQTYEASVKILMMIYAEWSGVTFSPYSESGKRQKKSSKYYLNYKKIDIAKLLKPPEPLLQIDLNGSTDEVDICVDEEIIGPQPDPKIDLNEVDICVDEESIGPQPDPKIDLNEVDIGVDEESIGPQPDSNGLYDSKPEDCEEYYSMNIGDKIKWVKKKNRN